MFMFTSYDILFMASHVLILDMYCAYYILDQDNYETYGWRREARNDLEQYIG